MTDFFTVLLTPFLCLVFHAPSCLFSLQQLKADVVVTHLLMKSRTLFLGPQLYTHTHRPHNLLFCFHKWHQKFLQTGIWNSCKYKIKCNDQCYDITLKISIWIFPSLMKSYFFPLKVQIDHENSKWKSYPWLLSAWFGDFEMGRRERRREMKRESQCTTHRSF